jgi:hypothetical protein
MIKHVFYALLFAWIGILFFVILLIYGSIATILWNPEFFLKGPGKQGLNDLMSFPKDVWEILKYGEWPI